MKLPKVGQVVKLKDVYFWHRNNYSLHDGDIVKVYTTSKTDFSVKNKNGHTIYFALDQWEPANAAILKKRLGIKDEV